MKTTLSALALLILQAWGQAAGGGLTMNTATTHIASLNKEETQALYMAAFEAEKLEDVLLILKSADSATRAKILALSSPRTQKRLTDDMAALPPADAARLAAAEKSVLALFEPASLGLIRGQALMVGGKYREAAAQYEAALKAGETRREYHLVAASCWAQADDKDAAFRQLDAAVTAGWLDTLGLQDDEDMARLHSDPRWPLLVARIGRRIDSLVKTLPDSARSLNSVKLPPPVLDGAMSVEKSLAQRRSVRQFADEPLTLAQISQVLWAAYGVSKPMPGAPPALQGGLKTAPSAGALYPLEVYVVAGNVTDLKPGIYRYHADGHELRVVRDGDHRRELFDASFGQTWVKTAPASLVYSAVFARNTGKYGQRGRERYVCMDLGHSGENVYLQCTALGLGTCAIGAFMDLDVRLTVQMTRAEEPLYIMPIGKLRP